MSYTFGRDIVQEFMETNKLSLICRAHQVVEDGYEFFSKRQVQIIIIGTTCIYRIAGNFRGGGGGEIFVVEQFLVSS